VLAAIVHTLLAASVTTIVLNVNTHNSVAQRLYERFGFATHCPFIEGVAVKKGVGNGA
jgi:predicted GNAT family acetyltransferase